MICLFCAKSEVATKSYVTSSPEVKDSRHSGKERSRQTLQSCGKGWCKGWSRNCRHLRREDSRTPGVGLLRGGFLEEVVA